MKSGRHERSIPGVGNRLDPIGGERLCSMVSCLGCEAQAFGWTSRKSGRHEARRVVSSQSASGKGTRLLI